MLVVTRHRCQLLTQLCDLVSDTTPCLQHWHNNARQLFFTPQKVANVAFEHASGALGHDKAERLHQSTDLIGYLQTHLKKLAPRGDQRADQHAVETFDADLSVEA